MWEGCSCDNPPFDSICAHEPARVRQALKNAGICDSVGQLLIERLGITSCDDFSFVRSIEPEFLLKTVFKPGELTPIEAMRICQQLSFVQAAPLGDEATRVITALKRAGIDDALAELVVKCTGAERWTDLSFLRQIDPQCLINTMTKANASLTIMQAVRICSKLRGVVRPSLSTQDNATAQSIFAQCDAVDVDVDNPSSKLLVEKCSKTIYIPTYATIVVNRLRNLKEVHKSIDLLLGIVLRFDFRSLPTAIGETIMERSALRINDVQCHVRDTEHDWSWMDENKTVAVLSIRLSLLNLSFTNNGDEVSSDYDHYADFPFDRPQLHFNIELVALTLSTSLRDDAAIDLLDSWKVRFNLHRFVHYTTSHNFATLPMIVRRYLDRKVQLKIRDHANKLPNFEILCNLATITFPLDAKSKVYYTPTVHVIIPLFRHPESALRSMVLPLLALNMGTLLTLFMNVSGTNYNDRLTNLSSLMVALLAFLGYVRTSMPEVPTSTWVDRAVLRSSIMAITVMADSLFAFLMTNDESVKSSGGTIEFITNSRRGGAFHFIWDRELRFRSILRCFGFGLPLVVVQLRTAFSLYRSYARYKKVLAMSARVVGLLNESENQLAGEEKFSRRQYVHPKIWDHSDRKCSLDAPPSHRRSWEAQALMSALEESHALKLHTDSREVLAHRRSFLLSFLDGHCGAIRRIYERRCSPLQHSLGAKTKIAPSTINVSIKSDNASLCTTTSDDDDNLRHCNDDTKSNTRSSRAISEMDAAISVVPDPRTRCTDRSSNRSTIVSHDGTGESCAAEKVDSAESSHHEPGPQTPGMKSSECAQERIDSLRETLERHFQTVLPVIEGSPSIPHSNRCKPQSSVGVSPSTSVAESPPNSGFPGSPSSSSNSRSGTNFSDTRTRRSNRRRRGGNMMYSLGEHPVWDADDA